MEYFVLKKKLIDAGCLVDTENNTIFVAHDCKIEETVREFKRKYKFMVQYEIR